MPSATGAKATRASGRSFRLRSASWIERFLSAQTNPATFWRTPHYAGHPAVLVRYDSPDPELVREMFVRAHDRAMAMKPPRPRKAR